MRCKVTIFYCISYYHILLDIKHLIAFNIFACICYMRNAAKYITLQHENNKTDKM